MWSDVGMAAGRPIDANTEAQKNARSTATPAAPLAKRLDWKTETACAAGGTRPGGRLGVSRLDSATRSSLPT
jgi:hypothetical protein